MRTSLAVIAGLALTATSLATPEVASSSLKALDDWNYLGCYTDKFSARSLLKLKSVPGGSKAMTNEACQRACGAAGYPLAGTEYAQECFCGMEIANGGMPAPGESMCNLKCKGDSSQNCGGSHYLTLFHHPGVNKRGISYDGNNPYQNATYANLFAGYKKISWAYNWAFPSAGLDASIEFVPMLWGKPWGGPQEKEAWSWGKAIEVPGTKFALAFNEPDLGWPNHGVSNIKPDSAADGYKKFMMPYKDQVKIGIPSVLWNNINGPSSGGDYGSRQWTKNFLKSCTGCTYNYAAIHYYADCTPANGDDGAAWFTSNMTDASKTLGLPLWITEFQCYGTEAEQISFIKKVLPWLDSQSFIQRYAYFGAFPGILVNAAGTGVSALGKVYAAL